MIIILSFHIRDGGYLLTNKINTMIIKYTHTYTCMHGQTYVHIHTYYTRIHSIYLKSKVRNVIYFVAIPFDSLKKLVIFIF